LTQRYNLNFEWLADAVGILASGVYVTLVLTVLTAVAGTILSIAGAAAQRSSVTPLRHLVSGYVELIRNTPFLVQLFFVFFGLPSLGIRLEATTAAILALTINYGAYGTETVGAGIDAVPIGEREAALALGLKPWQVFFKIVLPQAIVIIYPALTSLIIIVLLETAAVSQIAVRELTYEADLLQSQTFRAFETFLVVAFIYLGLSLGVRRLMGWAQWSLPKGVR
jgi:polar amino acid transport system permease protein